MVKRSENGVFGRDSGASEGSETLGLSYGVRRAAPSLPMQPEEPVMVRYGTATTATLTLLEHRREEADHVE